MSNAFSEVAERHSSREVALGLAVRRAVMTLFAAIVALGLIGVFGQRASESTASTGAATLRLSAPDTVRGGLLFQSKIDIRALRDIEFPRLVLDDGWVEGLQLNSIEPQPQSESSRNGRLVLSYSKLAAGDVLRIWFEYQVVPIYAGRRSYGLELDDERTAVGRIDRKLTVLP
jgi:hypothetical protein